MLRAGARGRRGRRVSARRARARNHPWPSRQGGKGRGRRRIDNHAPRQLGSFRAPPRPVPREWARRSDDVEIDGWLGDSGHAVRARTQPGTGTSGGPIRARRACRESCVRDAGAYSHETRPAGRLVAAARMNKTRSVVSGTRSGPEPRATAHERPGIADAECSGVAASVPLHVRGGHGSIHGLVAVPRGNTSPPITPCTCWRKRSAAKVAA